MLFDLCKSVGYGPLKQSKGRFLEEPFGLCFDFCAPMTDSSHAPLYQSAGVAWLPRLAIVNIQKCIQYFRIPFGQHRYAFRKQSLTGVSIVIDSRFQTVALLNIGGYWSSFGCTPLRCRVGDGR
jgi:hypothetical protein